jgi:spectinomycin phosphotransferase
MLQAPDIPEARLLQAVRQHFAIEAVAVTFLPIGNDTRSFVYRIDVRGGGLYFLKLRAGEPYLPSLGIPRLLRDGGLREVVAPLPARGGSLFGQIDQYTLLLYPFVSGDSAMQRGMSEAQWHAHGTALRQVHDTPVPPALAALLPRETWVPASLAHLIHSHRQLCAAGLVFDDSVRTEALVFWLARRATIERAIAQVQTMGAKLVDAGLPLVLCHADIHTANIMVDDAGQLHYVDWDAPMFAPKERDMKFVIGTQIGDPVTPAQEAAFLAGYGATPLDRRALAYFRTEWIIEDFADYAHSTFFNDFWGAEARAGAFGGLRDMFAPGGSVALALTPSAA